MCHFILLNLHQQYKVTVWLSLPDPLGTVSLPFQQRNLFHFKNGFSTFEVTAIGGQFTEKWPFVTLAGLYANLPGSCEVRYPAMLSAALTLLLKEAQWLWKYASLILSSPLTKIFLGGGGEYLSPYNIN